MEFYTNVYQRGDRIFVRGYDRGIRINKKINYEPYIFMENKDGDYKTIDGKPVFKFEFESIKKAHEFISQNEGVVNRKIYGLTNFSYLYIFDNFKGEINYKPDQVSIAILDIECAADEGFPNIQDASKEITAITIRHRKRSFVFGCGDFTTTDPNIYYIKCKNEEELLLNFIKCWRALDLDIVTGWNCIPTDQSVWLKNKIVKIKDLNIGDELISSKVSNISPISKKKKYIIKMSNGQEFLSSKDHKFPIYFVDKNKYTKFTFSSKENLSFNNKMSLDDIINIRHENEVFLSSEIRNNNNEDQSYTDDELYMAGLIYTDGSKDKYSYRFYQSDLKFITDIKTRFNIPNEISGPYKDNYNIRINNHYIDNVFNLIYDSNNKKYLNLELLSRLSYRQFCYFIAGYLDGDGCRSKNSISLCDYNNGIDILQELFLWNGIITSKSSENVLRIYSDINIFPVMKHDRWNGCETKMWLRKSSQIAKDTRWKISNNIMYNKIVDIIETDEYIDMMDIETDTHLFVSKGINTHNCEFFDIPYIINRINVLFGDLLAKKLSPWGFISENTVEFKGKENQVYDIAGITVLDYLQLYRKFTFGNQESYKLDYISQVELDEKKIDYSEYGNLLQLYKNNFQKFIEYNIHDCVLVERLDEKLKFLEQVMALAYDAKVNYNDTMTTVRPWDIIIHNYLLEKNIVIPAMESQEMNDTLVGGYVKEPKIGLSRWVVSFDLTSLYPSLIQQYNISPEKMIDKKTVKKMIEEEKKRRGLT